MARVDVEQGGGPSRHESGNDRPIEPHPAERLSRRELEALVNTGAPIAQVYPAREKLARILKANVGDTFVVRVPMCRCPVGFGSGVDPDCESHGVR
jgi:hypothetical protein